MGKWIVRIIVVGFLAFVGYQTYLYYDAGYFSAPEISDDSFLVSFNSGFRGVMEGFGPEDYDRRYLGYAKDVSSLYEEVWSTCRRPTDAELKGLEENGHQLPGIRWEAICEIDADGDVFIRGWVASIPDI